MEHLGGHAASSSPSSSRARTSSQLDDFKAIADHYGAQLRLTRLRPSGRGADVWDTLHPTAAQQRIVYDWLLEHGEEVLTGDSFFHLAAYGQSLPGPEPVRRGPRRLPDRPGRRRLRLPVRDPRDVPRRATCATAGFAPRVARVGAVPRAARAAVGRRVRELRDVRRLPRRLHGGEVLHRPAARRARPRVRARPRRGGARDAPTPRKSSVDHSIRRRAMVPVTVVDAALRRVAGLMAWFETVAEAERRAKRTLPPSVFKAIQAGTERGADARGQRRGVLGARLRAARRRARRRRASWRRP